MRHKYNRALDRNKHLFLKTNYQRDQKDKNIFFKDNKS